MGVLLVICISAFLALFVANNDATAMRASPLALGMVAIAVVADLYLLRSLVREWTRKREE